MQLGHFDILQDNRIKYESPERDVQEISAIPNNHTVSSTAGSTISNTLGNPVNNEIFMERVREILLSGAEGVSIDRLKEIIRDVIDIFNHDNLNQPRKDNAFIDQFFYAGKTSKRQKVETSNDTRFHQETFTPYGALIYLVYNSVRVGKFDDVFIDEEGTNIFGICPVGCTCVDCRTKAPDSIREMDGSRIREIAKKATQIVSKIMQDKEREEGARIGNVKQAIKNNSDIFGPYIDLLKLVGTPGGGAGMLCNLASMLCLLFNDNHACDIFRNFMDKLKQLYGQDGPFIYLHCSEPCNHQVQGDCIGCGYLKRSLEAPVSGTVNDYGLSNAMINILKEYFSDTEDYTQPAVALHGKHDASAVFETQLIERVSQLSVILRNDGKHSVFSSNKRFVHQFFRKLITILTEVTVEYLNSNTSEVLDTKKRIMIPGTNTLKPIDTIYSSAGVGRYTHRHECVARIYEFLLEHNITTYTGQIVNAVAPGIPVFAINKTEYGNPVLTRAGKQ